MMKLIQQDGEWLLQHRKSLVPFRFGYRLRVESRQHGFEVLLDTGDGAQPAIVFASFTTQLGAASLPHLAVETSDRYVEWLELCLHYNHIMELLESLSSDYETAWTLLCTLPEYEVRAVGRSEWIVSIR